VVINAYEKKLVFEMHQPGDLLAGRFELYRHNQRERANSKRLWPAVGTARTLLPSFSISDAYPLVASWMDECKSDHAERHFNNQTLLTNGYLQVLAPSTIKVRLLVTPLLSDSQSKT
jgi:hypothetical protein